MHRLLAGTLCVPLSAPCVCLPAFVPVLCRAPDTDTALHPLSGWPVWVAAAAAAAAAAGTSARMLWR